MNKVEDPKFAAMWEHAKKYWGNWLLVTNVNISGNKGKVIAYSDSKRELYDVIGIYDADPNTYGECKICWVGPNTSLGGLLL